ncbi:MAG: zinc-ribbon domain-containing protein [Pyrinomonadaceae bacterium]
MIITCQNCATRLQIDDDKSPSRPVAVRCPKCGGRVITGASAPACEQSALAVGGSPATEHPRFDRPNPAPVFEVEKSLGNQGSSSEELLRMMAQLFAKSSEAKSQSTKVRPAWDNRKVLICTTEKHRELIARRLAEQDYEVYIADDTRQAVERMRANQLDIVVLEPQFDPAEQGAAFVLREINVLRPLQRRRLFFALLSPSLRTMDAHAAFLNNVNAIVNVNDVADLPKILELALRDYNELYEGFNAALNVAAL